MKVIITGLSDQELKDLPDRAKIELTKRYEDRLTKISKDRIEELKKLIEKLFILMKKDDPPDQRFITIKLPVYVNYDIDHNTDEVYADSNCDDDYLRSLDITDDIDSIRLSKSVKARVNRIQNVWDKIRIEINRIRIIYDIPEKNIWDYLNLRHHI